MSGGIRGIGVQAQVVLKAVGASELLSGESAAALREIVNRAGAAAAEASRRLAPVRTGRLRDSIGWTAGIGENGLPAAAVGSDVPYAAAQELGTVRMPGKHYLEYGTAAGAEEVFGR